MDIFKKNGVKGKRGNAAVLSLVGVVISLVVAGIALVVGAQVTTSVQATQTANSVAYNTSTSVLQGLLNTGSQFGLIGLVAGLGVVMAVLFIYLGGFIPGFGRGGRY